jgi:CheY-like chemotaxis protein
LELFEIDSDTASSGPEAIELVKKNDYDIVFMDHMMPDMDGLETTAAIRALGEKYNKLNIVALTANAIQGAQEMFLANGLNGFLSKPIEMPNLRKTLLEWLPPDVIMKKAPQKKTIKPKGRPTE